ncbi:hypothetical protein PUN28_019400 [Cardiocondyla obscurior]|uniref:Uncharacterized protein n=1 Tax=Cardiocondyla obscurior TaxID=286306 RepID=A0AAW2EFA0_9HYME
MKFPALHYPGSTTWTWREFDPSCWAVVGARGMICGDHVDQERMHLQSVASRIHSAEAENTPPRWSRTVQKDICRLARGLVVGVPPLLLARS